MKSSSQQVQQQGSCSSRMMMFQVILLVAVSCCTMLCQAFAFAFVATPHPRLSFGRISISKSRRYLDSNSNSENDWQQATQTQAQKHAQTNPRQQKLDLQLIIIDHYDSFTYNLYDMVAQICEKPPIVLAKDAFENWSQVLAVYGNNTTSSSSSTIDGVILSPGPGTPTNPQDIGSLSPSILEQNPDLPILGVCLGHQIMGHFYGAKVDLCLGGPVHGQVWTIQHQQQQQQQLDNNMTTVLHDPLWINIPTQINVTRYHSLAVTLPPMTEKEVQVPLVPTAFTTTCTTDNENDDDASSPILMAMSHTTNPHYGVQFHPESIGSQYGLQLLKNFCNVCNDVKQKRQPQYKQEEGPASYDEQQKNNVSDNDATNTNAGTDTINKSARDTQSQSQPQSTDPDSSSDQTTTTQILIHKLSSDYVQLTPVEVFDAFLAEEPFSVWLDTSVGVQSATLTDNDDDDDSTTATTYSSIMGAGKAPIEYYGKEYPKSQQGLFRYNANGKDGKSRIICQKDGSSHSDIDNFDIDILTYLQKEHAQSTDSVSMVEFRDGEDGEEEEDDDDYNIEQFADDGSVLPFDFRGGHVGYLGYEVRHDSQRFLEEQEMGMHSKSDRPYSFESTGDGGGKLLQEKEKSGSSENQPEDPPVPTAAFLFLDKSWVYDHSKGDWYLISVVKDEEEEDSLLTKREALDWMRTTARKMKVLAAKKKFSLSESTISTPFSKNDKERKNAPPNIAFAPSRTKEVYNQNFADCQEQIRLGESYEICLTNHLQATVDVPKGSPPLGLYKVLRDRNPAPFSAFLNWNTVSSSPGQAREKASASLALCCSSPERFVSVKRKQVTKTGLNGSQRNVDKLEVEAKPIKGTCARVLPKEKGTELTDRERAEDALRALELKSSVKNRAENLMIVDLLRNDLSRVCEAGSVHVSNLMDIESYATVHQMVSTIRGTLDPVQANAVDILKATFPGGSMTGAPKVRTMEIIHQLEEGVSRGPYSGCLGYISMNGSMDMNIVIRTAVLTPSRRSFQHPNWKDGQDKESDYWKVSIGAGGAITALSESADEYEEMRLKASAVIGAVSDWVAKADGGSHSSLGTKSKNQTLVV